MADVIARFKGDTSDLDSKVKNASETLKAMANECRNVGGTLEIVEKKDLEFVRALGQMETKSTSTKGKMRELTQAAADMTEVYRNLSDQEKKSPFGQALNQSISQLVERAGAAKDAMADVNAAITNAASDTRTFDQISGAMTTMTSVMQVGQGAAKLLGVNLGDNVEVLAKLQAAMAVTNGLQVIQNNLQKQSAMMQGLNALKTAAAYTAQGLYALATGDATTAQIAFNIAADANPWGALLAVVGAAAAAVAMFASNTDELSESEKNETATSKAQTDILKLKQEAMKKQSANYVDAVAKIRQLVATAKDENAELNARNAACKELNKMDPSIQANINKTTGAFTAQANAIMGLTSKLQTYYKMLAAQDYLKELYKKQVELEVKKDTFQTWLNGAQHNLDLNKKRQSDAEQNLSLEGNAMDYDFDAISEGEAESRSNSASDLIRARRNVAHYTGSVQTAQNGLNQTNAELAQTNSNLSSATKILDNLTKQNNGFKPVDASKATGGSSGGHSGGKNTTKTTNEIAFKIDPKSDFSEAELKKIFAASDKSSDAAGKLGLTLKADNVGDLKDMISGQTTITDDDPLRGFREKLRQNAEGYDYSEIENAGKKAKKAWIEAASAVGSVGQALQEIDNPAAKVFGIIAEAVANVASGFAQALANSKTGKLSTWAWIAEAAAGTATMISTIAAIKSATSGSYAEGGIIGGSSYSGDRLNANVNSGELILNRAQQGNLASQLSGTGMSALNLSATIKGENIRLALNNNSRRTGRGEYVTTK